MVCVLSKRSASLALTAGLALGVSAARGDIEFAGNVASEAFDATSAEVALDNGPLARIEFLAADLVRVRFAPTGVFADRPTGALLQWAGPPPVVSIDPGGKSTMLQANALEVEYTLTPFRVAVRRNDGSPLAVDDPATGLGWDTTSGWVFVLQQAPAGEAYLGLGERGGDLDRRGRSFVLANTDSFGWTDDSDPLYISIPFFYGLAGGKAYGIFLDNASIPFFDFDSAGNGLRAMAAVAGELDYYVMAGPSPAGVLGAYSALTGTPALPPIWALGYHQSRFGYQTQDEVVAVAQGFRDRDIPLDAIHIDIDHMDNLQVFTWDPARFPDPSGMNAELRQMGVRSVVLIEPLLLTYDPKWPLFAGSGFFLQRGDIDYPHVGQIFLGEVSFIDFSNPLGSYWWGLLHVGFLGTGVSGVWNDLNEPAENSMPLDVRHDFNGETRPHRDARNLYALQHTSLTKSVLEGIHPDERPFILSRSGFSGIQRNAAVWTGDGNSTWEGFRTATAMGLSMSISGLSFFGHDVGGFLGDPGAELYARWTQAGAFTPFFRTHSINTAPPREPWSFGPIVESIARHYLKMRESWMPYLYTAFEEASRTGLPVVRPLVFDFPDDPVALTHADAWLFGPSVLVAPVLEAGAASRQVYLPAGSDWVDFWSDTTYAGGSTVTAAAPLGFIPLFVRAGSFVPTSYARDYAEQPLPRDLLIEAYPAGVSQYTLYEDDGISRDFEAGGWLRTIFTSNGAGAFFVARFGAFDPGPRTLTLRAHDTPRPATVLFNGELLPELRTPDEQMSLMEGWFHDVGAMRLSIRVNDAGDPIILVAVP